MINDFYINCELWGRTQTEDPSGGKIWTYTKTSDITGIMVPKSTNVLINGMWKTKQESLFVTNTLVGNDQTVKYQGQLYQKTSAADNVMEMNHHYEVKMELINNV